MDCSLFDGDDVGVVQSEKQQSFDLGRSKRELLVPVAGAHNDGEQGRVRGHWGTQTSGPQWKQSSDFGLLRPSSLELLLCTHNWRMPAVARGRLPHSPVSAGDRS